MNARIINLRTRRKQKARGDKQRQAAQHIAEGKLAGPDRQKAKADETTRVARLDAHLRDDAPAAEEEND